MKMDENHDCISKLTEQIKADNPDIVWVDVELSTIRNMNNKIGVHKTAQPIKYSYKHEYKNGTVTEKTTKSFITHLYCPFCGEKYI